MHNTLFWQASFQEVCQGYSDATSGESLVCLLCGEEFDKELIYKVDGQLFTATKAIKAHIKKEHGSVFEYLISLDKKITGLSDAQRDMLINFYNLNNDADIAKEMGISRSTVRNYRFRFKERAKQAKIILALMTHLENSTMKEEKIIDVHRSARMVDERYAITEAEKEKVIANFFTQDGQLVRIPKKQKKKIIILQEITKHFKYQRNYTEKEVNTILKGIYADYVSLRRYLIEYGFFKREEDCSRYWLCL